VEPSDWYSLLLIVVSLAVVAFLVLFPVAVVRGILRGRAETRQPEDRS
jgi:hypothetical protein